MKPFLRTVSASARAEIEILESRIAPAQITTLIWQGDLATSGWNDGTVGTNTNWISSTGLHLIPADGMVLVFPATPVGGKTNNNDIAGLDLRSLSFSGVGYEITGEAITLSGGITANGASVGNNGFHPTITLAANQTFNSTSAAGSLFKFDSIDLAGKTLTVDGASTLRLGTLAGSKVTGQGALIKTGTGVLALTSANDFTGPVQVNAGILEVTNNSGLGATGEGNGTTIASGASLLLVTATVPEDIFASGPGAVGQPGAIVSNVNFTLTGALRFGSDVTIGGPAGSAPKITLGGTVGAADDALAIVTIKTDPAQDFAFTNAAAFTTELAGTTPGAGGHDQLKVFGQVNLGNATLNVVPSFTPQVGDKFRIVDNDGIDPITGTFAGLAQSATFTSGGVNFTIIYNGGDGNDVVLTVDSLVNPPVPVTLSNGGKTATFTDVDGDIVTVKTTKGPFQQSDFSIFGPGVGGGGQLQQIALIAHPADFAGAGLSITAKPGPLGGNGFVNVGYINATGIDLGAVTVAGDLGRINAGALGGAAKVPALKSLTVQSIGLLGVSTQAAGGSTTSLIAGAVPKLSVKGDIRDVTMLVLGVGDGILGKATIGGSIVNTQASSALAIFCEAGIGTMKIGGDLRTVSATASFDIQTRGAIGALIIGGSIASAGVEGVHIQALGKVVAPTAGLDLAIKSITVRGAMENAVIDAGFLGNNADASIGAIVVGGDWIASVATAGSQAGPDGKLGTADDAKSGGRDNPAIFSSIGGFTVKGQALGTAGITTDSFGIVSERIGKAKVGGRTFAFTNGATPDAFFAAPTGPLSVNVPGVGLVVGAFDFTIRELGSLTPAITVGAPLDISSDGRTATFTDVDGDLVTVKRSAGAFVTGNFIFTAAGSGAQLRQLTISAAPGDAPVDVSITAKPSSVGGNGFVNIGDFSAAGVSFGSVSIAGDVGSFGIGKRDPARLGVKSLTVHSFGALGLSTGAPGLIASIAGGIGALTVQGDVRGGSISADGPQDGKLGTVVIAGSLISTSTVAQVRGEVGIGSVKIGGSVRGGQIDAGAGAIGSIIVGGDLVGDGSNATIGAFGQLSAPATGLDLALKSLTVKGNVENTRIELGRNGNADASLGALSVGRAWLASSVLAGTTAGVDTFTGTSDDAKVTVGGPIDVVTRFSTIGSITIKGQALGTTATSDSFGIVAEVIGKAKIGTRTFALTAGAKEAFAAAPTGPGPSPDDATSDFFLREIGA